MARDEVRVQVGQENVLDLEVVLDGERDVAIDVALRVDDGRHTRLLVTDEVGRVGETAEVELLEDHWTSGSNRSAVRKCEGERNVLAFSIFLTKLASVSWFVSPPHPRTFEQPHLLRLRHDPDVRLR